MKKFSTITENLWLDDKSRQTIIDMLKNALKEEFNAWYGYIIIREFLAGKEHTSIMKFYDDTAKDELEDHGYWLMKRINELGGTLDDISATPAIWETAVHKYRSPKWYESAADEKYVSTEESLKINIKNEKDAISTYREIEEFTRNIDPVTNQKIKEILADEEEHLTSLNEFLDDITV
jgi:ferritin-like protein